MKTSSCADHVGLLSLGLRNPRFHIFKIKNCKKKCMKILKITTDLGSCHVYSNIMLSKLGLHGIAGSGPKKDVVKVAHRQAQSFKMALAMSCAEVVMRHTWLRERLLL